MPAAEHAEVGQRNRRAAQLLERNATRQYIVFHRRQAAAQVGRITLSHIAQDRREQPIGRIHGDGEIDFAV